MEIRDINILFEVSAFKWGQYPITLEAFPAIGKSNCYQCDWILKALCGWLQIHQTNRNETFFIHFPAHHFCKILYSTRTKTDPSGKLLNSVIHISGINFSWKLKSSKGDIENMDKKRFKIRIRRRIKMHASMNPSFWFNINGYFLFI